MYLPEHQWGSGHAETTTTHIHVCEFQLGHDTSWLCAVPKTKRILQEIGLDLFLDRRAAVHSVVMIR